VDRVLRDANIKKWLAKSRPKLKAVHIAKRLRWATAHRDWTAEDFERVIWSDECSVEKSRDPRQQWVFREPGEQWLADCIHPKEKDKGISLMVWGCFWGKRKGPLVPITQNINKTRYVRLLRRHLFPVIHQMISFGMQLEDILFQQDNAPVHKAYSVMEWFERNSIELVEHPPYSPDLNPIEHVWVELKKRLHQQYPRIGDTPGGKEAVKRRLAQVLPLVWETIPEEFFEKLWKSMPDRVAAVLEARGGYTKY
jgi:transposase